MEVRFGDCALDGGPLLEPLAGSSLPTPQLPSPTPSFFPSQLSGFEGPLYHDLSQT